MSNSHQPWGPCFKWINKITRCKREQSLAQKISQGYELWEDKKLHCGIHTNFYDVILCAWKDIHTVGTFLIFFVNFLCLIHLFSFFLSFHLFCLSFSLLLSLLSSPSDYEFFSFLNVSSFAFSFYFFAFFFYFIQFKSFLFSFSFFLFSYSIFSVHFIFCSLPFSFLFLFLHFFILKWISKVMQVM